MIRGHPLRKTGSAASHGGLSTELFYYKSGRLATGKKQMWRVSQKIHRGSLAFFGKWDKINRIRGMPRPKKCAAEWNPPVGTPPLGKEAGDADCHTSDIGHWFAMTEVERICVSFRDQSADWSWESVIPQHKGRGERIATAGVRTGFAMTGFFTRGAVQARFGPSRTPAPTHRLPIELRRGRRPRRPASPQFLLRFRRGGALLPTVVPTD